MDKKIKGGSKKVRVEPKGPNNNKKGKLSFALTTSVSLVSAPQHEVAEVRLQGDGWARAGVLNQEQCCPTGDTRQCMETYIFGCHC